MNRRSIVNVFALTLGLFVFSMQSSVRAAEITFLCAGALEATVEELIPEFQKVSGHNVKATFAAIGVIARQLRNGDMADVAIISPQQWEDLRKEAKVDATVQVIIAKVGVGVFVKRGAAKPDINSVEAFKRALLNAKSIALADPAGGGPVGIYATSLFERLGISAAVTPKLKLVGGGLAPVEPVTKGDAEIGLTTISEILPVPDIELVGQLRFPHAPACQVGLRFGQRDPHAARTVVARGVQEQ